MRLGRHATRASRVLQERDTRYYRETLGKLEEAARQFEQDAPTFLVEFGDLIDGIHYCTLS